MGGFIALVIMVGSGMATCARVITPPESRNVLLTAPFMVIINMLAVITFVMSLLGLLIAKAHYQQWKQSG